MSSISAARMTASSHGQHHGIARCAWRRLGPGVVTYRQPRSGAVAGLRASSCHDGRRCPAVSRSGRRLDRCHLIVDTSACHRYVDRVEIAGSARKHGIADEDILHALRNVLRYIQQDYDGETRLFIIGADRGGRLLEIVAVPAADPQRVIHADALRPKFYDYL